MTDRIIIALAVIGVGVGLSTMFDWSVGVVASVGLAAWLYEDKVRRANRAWEDKWRAREAEWQAGDHRARSEIVLDERDHR
jgi:hypothetical protein